MRPILALTLLFAIAVASCKNEPKPTAAAPPAKTADTPKTALGDAHTAELMAVLAHYYTLKDALVASDSVDAAGAAQQLVSATDSLRKGLGDLPEYTELQPQLEKVMKASAAILAASNKGIETQRTHFATISDGMFKALKIANLKGRPVYQQYCPMAFDNKGGYWLSAVTEIENPYFGEKMMHCGDVRDSL